MYNKRIINSLVLLALIMFTAVFSAGNIQAKEIDHAISLGGAEEMCTVGDWEDVISWDRSTGYDTYDAKKGHCKKGLICGNFTLCDCGCWLWGECGEGEDKYRCCKIPCVRPCHITWCCLGHK